MAENQAVQAKNQATELRELPTVACEVDIFESGDGYLLRADLPGVARNDVDIQFERGELTLKARREYQVTGEPLASEFGGVLYKRSFRFPESVDAGQIHAELKAGVLTLTLPKSPEVRPRKIAIQGR